MQYRLLPSKKFDSRQNKGEHHLQNCKLSMMAHTYDPSFWDAETRIANCRLAVTV